MEAPGAQEALGVQAVEREKRGVAGARAERQGEGASPGTIPSCDVGLHQRFEAAKLGEVGRRRAGIGVVARIPKASMKDALLRGAHEEVLGGCPVRVERAELGKECPEGPVRGVRERQIVRTEWVAVAPAGMG